MISKTHKSAQKPRGKVCGSESALSFFVQPLCQTMISRKQFKCSLSFYHKTDAYHSAELYNNSSSSKLQWRKGMGLCQNVHLCFHGSSLSCLHTFWHAIPSSFYTSNIFIFLYNSLTTVGYLLGVFFRLWIPFLVRNSTSAWSQHWELELKLLWHHLLGFRTLTTPTH